MTSQNVVEKTLEGVASFAGFSRHSGAWYLRNAETIEVVELQKSQYGQQYYVNAALWLLPLGESQFPKEEKCHIRSRLGVLFPEHEHSLKQILDLEYPMDEATRVIEFRRILETLLLPTLAACSTLARLKGRTGDRLLKSSLVTKEAQKLLGLGVDRPVAP